MKSLNQVILITIILLLSNFKLNSQEPFTPTSILTPEQKVYGLSKFWQEANYNFVFMEKVNKKTWDSTYIALLKEVVESKNDW